MIFSKLWIFTFLLISCGNVNKNDKPKDKLHTSTKTSTEILHNDNSSSPITRVEAKYNLAFPDKTYVLGSELVEISGLCYIPEEDTFIANNDEEGKIYFLNKEFKVEKEIKFGYSGDYEAIARKGEKMFIAESSGKISVFDMISKTTQSIKTGLSSSNDIEGLCFDITDNNLLIACKGTPLSVRENKKETKAIYKYNLEKEELLREPHIKILDADLEDFARQSFTTFSKSELKKVLKRIRDFSPSGIAVHPETKDIYIISAKGSTLVIYNEDKQLKHVAILNKKTIPQPEGITFDTNYNLYISTEGKGLSAKVFCFNPIIQ